MDIWMSVYNTTTQGLNQFIKQSMPDKIQKQYLVDKFNQLIGSVKLFMSLDQYMGFSDNFFIDSGLIRGLYRYSNDEKICRLKDELKNTLLAAADKIIYIFDNRISNENPESLLKRRFEITAKGDFIHSAAFGDEDNWKGIENYDELVNKIPEYKFIFDFLIEFLERIPKENIIRDPREINTFGLFLEHRYDMQKAYFQDGIALTIYSYFKHFPTQADRTRTNFYQYTKNHLDPDTGDALNLLFADKIYNEIPIQGFMDRFKFEVWDNFWGTQELFDKVYRLKRGERAQDKLRKSINRLYEKGKMFNFLASQNIETISSIRSGIKSYFISEKSENKKNLAKKVLWNLYNSRNGDELNKDYTNIGLDAVDIVADNLPPTKLVVPILKLFNEHGKKLQFMYLTIFNKEYRSLMNVFEHLLSKD